MNALFLTTLPTLKACNSPYIQYYFKRFFILHSSEGRNTKPPPTNQPPTTDHQPQWHLPPTTDHRPQWHHRPPTWHHRPFKGTTDHWSEKPPTTDQWLWKNRPPTRTTTDHRPPTRLRLLNHRPLTTLQICFIYCAIFLPLPFYGTECHEWMVHSLICQVKPGLLKLTVLQPWIMTAWLLVAFWDKMCKVHLQKFTWLSQANEKDSSEEK